MSEPLCTPRQVATRSLLLTIDCACVVVAATSNQIAPCIQVSLELAGFAGPQRNSSVKHGCSMLASLNRNNLSELNRFLNNQRRFVEMLPFKHT